MSLNKPGGRGVGGGEKQQIKKMQTVPNLKNMVESSAKKNWKAPTWCLGAKFSENQHSKEK